MSDNPAGTQTVQDAECPLNTHATGGGAYGHSFDVNQPRAGTMNQALNSSYLTPSKDVSTYPDIWFAIMNNNGPVDLGMWTEVICVSL